MNKKLIAVALLSLSIHGVASAGGEIAGATEFTQIENKVQLVMSYAEEAQQTVTQLQQYQTMLRNLMSITPSQIVDQAAQRLFTSQKMYDSFKRLQTLVVNGQSMAYSLANLDARFKQLHPGYGNFGNGFDFGRQYTALSNNTLDSVKNSMSLISAHAEDFDTEQELMGQLQTRSATAQGQMQALQAGNEIGMTMVGQMQKMRQLQMAQMNAQNAFISGQQTKQDATEAQMQQYVNNAKSFKPEVSTGKVIFK